MTKAQEYPHDVDFYYELRDKFNQENLSDVEEAALLLYFNKTAYNGLYRVNSKGDFNVPFGRYKNPKIVVNDIESKMYTIVLKESYLKYHYQPKP